MSDLDNDQSVDDAALFASVVSGEPQADGEPGQPRDDTGRFASKTTPEIITPVAQPQPVGGQPAAPALDPAADAHVPSSRLREEADARRAAERERDDLRARLAERQQPQPAQPEPAKAPDFWEAPDQFTDGRIKTAISPIENMFRSFILSQSMEKATAGEGGKELVAAAEQSVRQAVQAGDPDALALLGRLKTSFHPVGDIVTFHRNRTALSEIGNDPAAYKQRVLDEAMKDPAFQAKVLEASRQTAQTGRTVVDTGRPTVTPITPSIRNIGGAGASPATAEAPSDAELFSSITTGRRRA